MFVLVPGSRAINWVLIYIFLRISDSPPTRGVLSLEFLEGAKKGLRQSLGGIRPFAPRSRSRCPGQFQVTMPDGGGGSAASNNSTLGGADPETDTDRVI